MEVKMDNTVDDQAFVLFDVSPLDFLNLFNFLFNSIFQFYKSPLKIVTSD